MLILSYLTLKILFLLNTGRLVGEKSPTFYLLTIKYNTNYDTSYNIRDCYCCSISNSISIWSIQIYQIIYLITFTSRRSFDSFCFINNILLKNIKSNSAYTNYLQCISVLLNNIKSNFAIIIIHFYFKSSFLFMIYNSDKVNNFNNKNYGHYNYTNINCTFNCSCTKTTTIIR